MRPVHRRLLRGVVSRLSFLLAAPCPAAPEKRRWLRGWGIFLATAIGGIVAYLLARRRFRKAVPPEEASVGELSARLRQEAAKQERRVRPGVGGRSAGRRRGRRLSRKVAQKVAEEPPSLTADRGEDASEQGGDGDV